MKSTDIKILINLHVFEWMSMDTSIVDRFKFLYSYNVLNNLQQYFIFLLLNCIIKLYLCNIVVCDNKYMTPEIILISFFWVKLMIKVTYSEKECSLYWEHGNHNQNTFHFPVHLSQFEKHWGKISPIQLSHFDCHYSDLVDKKLRI